MGMRIFCGTWMALCVLVIFSQMENTHARSNGLIKRCGSYQRQFVRWICNDPTFDYPFPFHRIYLILRYGAPSKQFYPFQHQAVTCCRHGCSQKGYRRMCRYHKMYKRCSKTKNLSQQSGRKPRLLAICKKMHSNVG